MPGVAVPMQACYTALSMRNPSVALTQPYFNRTLKENQQCIN